MKLRRDVLLAANERVLEVNRMAVERAMLAAAEGVT